MQQNLTVRGGSGVTVNPAAYGGVNNTELAAALVTLGFTVLDMTRLRGDGVDARHAGGVVAWRFSETSADGRYTLGQVLQRWNDKLWLNDPTNDDPLAHIIAAFHNRRRLLDTIKQGVAMVAISQGKRFALVPERLDEHLSARVGDHFAGRLPR